MTAPLLSDSPQPHVELRGVGKSYGGIRILSNIDLAPTLCELGGCTLGPFPDGQAGPDGESFAQLGTMGPTRMDYPATMAAVGAVARYVGRILADG